jgi:CheY-like chemotaxis protein
MLRVINILLVEDDVLDQIEVKRTLEKKGILHLLKIARNGEDALQMLQDKEGDLYSGVPDLILVDLNMPKMNGFEFLEKIQEMPELKDTKIFVLTTSDDPEDKNLASKFGISGFITKPLKLQSPSSLDAFNLMIDLMNMQVK